MRFRLANRLAALPTTVQRRIAGAPVVRDGQRLDLETQLWLKLLALADAPDRDAMTVSEVRAMVAAEEGVTQGHRLDGICVHEPTIEGAAGLLGARLHAPDPHGFPVSVDGDGDALLVYYHGGAFVVCDLRTHDNPCRFLALHAGVRVLSVDYRMAPEDPFPAAFDDAVAAFRYAVAHADESALIGTGSQSAEPAPAAIPQPAWLALPPVTAGRGRAADAPLPVARPGRAASFLRAVWRGLRPQRCRSGVVHGSLPARPHDARDPRCSPMLAQDLAGVAPANVATAGFDPLRDEAEDYALRLRDAASPSRSAGTPGSLTGPGT